MSTATAENVIKRKQRVAPIRKSEVDALRLHLPRPAEEAEIPPIVEVPRQARPKPEMDSRRVNPAQAPTIEHATDERSQDLEIEQVLEKEQADNIAFSNEPVTLLIHMSGERFSPKTTDLVSVNGIKAEMLFRNGWVQIGYLPRGQKITIKRKYLEQLALSRHDNINTVVVGGMDVERPRNLVERNTTAGYSFTIMEDKNPRGAAWLESLLRM